MKAGIELITEERVRQIFEEGWSVGHDTVRHMNGELTQAAQCYATVAGAQSRGSSVEEWPVEMFDGHNDSIVEWPWEPQWYKPSDNAVRNLVKAGALIAAEIDRLQNTDAIGNALQRYQDR